MGKVTYIPACTHVISAFRSTSSLRYCVGPFPTMFNQIGGLVALQLASAFTSGSSSTNDPTTTPQILLDRYIPGFGPVHTLILTWTGVDITFIATRIAILLALYAGTRFLFQQLYAVLIQFCTSTISIGQNDILNREVLSWMSSNIVVKRGSRLLAAQTVRAGEDGVIDPFDMPVLRGIPPPIMNGGDDGRSHSVRFFPAVGTHFFFFRGRPFVFELCGRDTRSTIQVNTGQEPIILRCLGRDPEPLKHFLSCCKDFGKKTRQSMTTVCTADEHSPSMWGRTTVRPSRPLATIDIVESAKQSLLKDIEQYLEPSTRRFYSNRGIPYRRGYLFHGAPGTGKTSLSFALAGHFKLNLYIMSLSSPKVGDSELESMFGQLPEKCIILLEDIDSARIERGKKYTAEEMDGERVRSDTEDGNHNRGRITLSGLLNAIDGSASQEGRVLIMTSNSPENLDDALLRPGRVDKQIYFPATSTAMAARLFVRMFTKDEADDLPSIVPATESKDSSKVENNDEEEKKEVERIEAMSKEFATRIPEDKLTPAEIQGFLLDYRKSPDEAIENVDAWVSVLLEAKSKGTAVLDHFMGAVISKQPPKDDMGALTPPSSPGGSEHGLVD
jgi:chaperone BCS1